MPWSADRTEAPQLSLLAGDVLEQLNSGNHEIVEKLPNIRDRLAQFSLECVWAVAEGKLQSEQLPMTIKAAGTEGSVSSILTHAFWLVWTDIEGPHVDNFCDDYNAPETVLGTSEQGSRVAAALDACIKQDAIMSEDALEVLELNLLVQSGAIHAFSEGNSFGKKILIARNSKFLKIPTFNVFREELEGYAKLITLLNNPALALIESKSRICTEMDQLAGYYQLSPSKVASCILVAMEKDLSAATVLLELPYLLPRWCMDHVKFTMQGHRAFEGSEPLSQAFFCTIAVLLKKEKLVLEDVCRELAMEFDSLPDTKSMLEMVKNAVSETTASSGNVLLASNLNLDLSVSDCKLTELMNLPQWPAMQFVHAVVENGAWSHVRILLQQTKFQFLLHRDVCMALSDRLEEFLDPSTRVMFPTGPLGPCILPTPNTKMRKDLVIAEPFPQEALQILEALGPFLFRRPDLLASLWRIIFHLLLTHDHHDTATEDAIIAIRDCALPASMFLGSHMQVWLLAEQALFELPQLVRCKLYHHTAMRLHIQPQHRTEKIYAMGQGAGLALFKIHASRIDSHLGALCKKLVIPRTKESIQRDLRPACLHVGKVITAHPIAAASRIVELCRMYDTSTEIFVTFSGTLLPVEREIIMYEAVRNLLVQTKDRTSLQQTGPAEWLTNLAMFIGRFVTQYQDLDLYVLFAHMSHNMRTKTHPLEVVVAGCIFDNAFGSLPEQVNMEQRLSLFYGPLMRSYKLKNDFFSAQTLSMQCERLLQSLHGWKAHAPSLIIPLYVLLCQQRSDACSNSTNVRASFEATQRTHHVVLQYIELMKRLPVTELAEILPKLSVLIQKFQIGAECAMSVYRPLLRLLCGLTIDAAPESNTVGDEHMEDAVVIPLPPTDKAVLGPRMMDGQPDDHEWATGIVRVAVEVEEGASNPQEDMAPGTIRVAASVRELVSFGMDCKRNGLRQKKSAVTKTCTGMGISTDAFFKDLCSCVPMLAHTNQDQPQIAAASSDSKDPAVYSAPAKPLISPQFYVMFWALELPDLAENVKETYATFEAALKADLDEKSKRLRDLQNAENRGRNPRQWVGRNVVPEEPVVTKADVFEATEEVTNLQAKVQKVPQECDALFRRSNVASKAFERYARLFSPSGSGQKNLCNSFMQECIVPRCIFSVEDALFCAQMLYRMALLDPPHFQFPHALQAVFNEVSVLLRSCTQQETMNLSFFFKQMFLLVDQLTKDGLLPKIDQGDNASKWNILKKKHQKQMCGVLTTVLNAPDSGELIQKNALNMINELMAHLVTDPETQTSLLASLSTLEKKLEESAKSGEMSSVQMLLNAVMRQVKGLNLAKSPEGNRDDRNDAEEGEVVMDADAQDGDEGFNGKRQRDNGLDDARHGRPRILRQFGGERGTQHR